MGRVRRGTRKIPKTRMGDRAGGGVEIEGFEELKEMVDKINPRAARQIARAAVHAVAGIVRNEMRTEVKAGSRGGGDFTHVIAKAIKSKKRRGTPNEAVSDVRIEHGSGAKHDAFFWHWVEFEYGGVARPATPYISPVLQQTGKEIPQLYREEFGKKLEAKLAKEAAKQGVNRR